MVIRFKKMHGCGNDFLILDGIQGGAPDLSRSEIQFLCDRHYGIGADGLVALRRSAQTDVAWTFFNPDGSVAEMCGNAARCVVRYVSERYLQGESIGIETARGIIKGRMLSNSLVEVALMPEKYFTPKLEEKVLTIEDTAFQLFSVNTGVPHAVIEVTSLEKTNIEEIGWKVQGHPTFIPHGTNVTFYERVVGPKIRSTTFERGVFAQTLACGTGAAAAAVVFCENYLENAPITVEVPGGILEVDISPVSRVLLLRGPANYVVDIEIDELPLQFEQRRLFGKRFAEAT